MTTAGATRAAGGYVRPAPTPNDHEEPVEAISAEEGVSDAELRRLRALSDAGSPRPWTAMVEGRDFTGGDSFVMIGGENARAEDMYISRDSGPAPAADLDLIAQARTYLPRLLDEIERLRAEGRTGPADHHA